MSDAVLQELIIRMATDTAFSERVKSDPGALEGFDLTTAERTRLTSLEGDSGKGAEGLSSRESKSSIFNLGGLHEGGGHHLPVNSDVDSAPVHHAPATPIAHEASPVQPVPAAPHSPADAGFLSPLVGIVDAVAPVAKEIPVLGSLAGAAQTAVDIAGGIVGGHAADTGDHAHAATAADGTPLSAPTPVTTHVDVASSHHVAPGPGGHVPAGSHALHAVTHVPPGGTHLAPGTTAAPPAAGPAPVPPGSPALGGGDPLGGGLVGGGTPADAGHVQGGMPIGPGHVPPPPGIGHAPAPVGDPAASAPGHVNLTPPADPGHAPSGSLTPDTAGSHPLTPPVHTPPTVPTAHGHPVATDGEEVKPTLGGVRQYLQGGPDKAAQ